MVCRYPSPLEICRSLIYRKTWHSNRRAVGYTSNFFTLFFPSFPALLEGARWVLTCSYLRASVHEWPLLLLNSNGNQLLLPRSSLFQRQVIFLPAIALFFLGIGGTRGSGFIWELRAAFSLELAALSWQGNWTLDRNFFWLAFFYLHFLGGGLNLGLSSFG